MKFALKHISMVALLLFIFTIGGRAVLAIGGCHCVEDIVNVEHHDCCSCDDHIDECANHFEKVDSACGSHGLGVDQIEALVADSKLSAAKRVVVLTLFIISCLGIDCEVAPCSDDRAHNVVAHCLDWICDVGLLRAPPCC